MYYIYYYINKINSLSSNPHATFALARKLIAPYPPLHIPYIPNIPKNKLCNEFSNFFSNKILSTCSMITSLHQKYSSPCILISNQLISIYQYLLLPQYLTFMT